MKFGQFARAKRQQAGLTQHQVAVALGYSHRANIARLEAGSLEWKLSSVRKLAGLLGVKTSELLAEAEFENK